MKEGFLQVELDEESSQLTVFQTPWGRYRFHRMPFGITPALEIFQMKHDQNLEGLKGVFKIADDILITGQGGETASVRQMKTTTESLSPSWIDAGSGTSN